MKINSVISYYKVANKSQRIYISDPGIFDSKNLKVLKTKSYHNQKANSFQEPGTVDKTILDHGLLRNFGALEKSRQEG